MSNSNPSPAILSRLFFMGNCTIPFRSGHDCMPVHLAGQGSLPPWHSQVRILQRDRLVGPLNFTFLRATSWDLSEGGCIPHPIDHHITWRIRRQVKTASSRRPGAACGGASGGISSAPSRSGSADPWRRRRAVRVALDESRHTPPDRTPVSRLVAVPGGCVLRVRQRTPGPV